MVIKRTKSTFSIAGILCSVKTKTDAISPVIPDAILLNGASQKIILKMLIAMGLLSGGPSYICPKRANINVRGVEARAMSP